MKDSIISVIADVVPFDLEYHKETLVQRWAVGLALFLNQNFVCILRVILNDDRLSELGQSGGYIA